MSEINEQAPPPHKRNRSAVTRALQRISSRGEVPTVSSSAEIDDDAVPPSPGLLHPGAPRSSMQGASRPHLSTTISNTTPSTSARADPSPTTSMASPSAPQGASIEQSVKLFKVLEALRNGDHAIISRAATEDGLEGTTVLHLAIQTAQQPTIEYVLSQMNLDPNARDRDGNTPLHIASSLGRAPVVQLLLRLNVNETIPNLQGKTASDLARSPEIFQELQLARSVFIETQVKKVHEQVRAGDYKALEALLNDSHVKSVLDVNSPELASDPATTEHGGTLLHEAARARDLKLAQLLLLNGADPFRRDRKGKLPQDVTKDDRTRAILKKSPAAQAAQHSIQEKTILAPSADSGPGGKESREMKGYLRKWTNFQGGYKLRWFVLEDGVLSYAKNQDDAQTAVRGAINMRIAKLSINSSDKLLFEIHGKSSVKYSLKANHEVEAKRWFWALNNAITWAKDEAKEEAKRQQQEALALRGVRNEHIERQKTKETEGGLLPATATSVVGADSASAIGSALGDQTSAYEPSDSGLEAKHPSRTATSNIAGDADEDDDASEHEVRPTSRDAFSVAAESAKLQLDLLGQMSSALAAQAQKQPDLLLADPVVTQAFASYDIAVGNLKSLLVDLLRISRDHEAYWQYRLDREQDIRRLWEDSMARVAQEQEELETRIGESEDKRKRTKRALKEALEGGAVLSPGLEEKDLSRGGLESPQEPSRPVGRRPTIAQLTNNQVSDDESDDEEEFFDAVDAGELEVAEEMPPSSPAPTTTADPMPSAVMDSASQQRTNAKAQEISKSFRGYEDGVRTRYKLDNDNRPKISLWQTLKSMIGKDMTRMTLPVSFNEPTSLLYRVVEDMEYTDLLDIASERTESTERLVYVAAFAASEYASTIGRAQKPFNPLLGETYEYCRPDLGYRFFIEQVSHHPPVGAAFAESPRWIYQGESSVRSKFYGKSFEFNPLGTWFLHLRTPDGGEELYTWKKVTSSVVGIITGNPTVDNYGPMEVKNWTTGDVCYLDFKARGWKASSAYQVTGKVVDSSKRTCWSIGGRWNDKIYARKTPGYEADLGAPDAKSQAVLVWEAHERPTGIPFNVTPFVVTLNALPDRLRPYIAPTDSRLRPDQRAMEDGLYDFAAEEKNRVEQGQRARRRVREARGEDFVPRWFKKAKHPVTGEEYWEFNHEYWKVREEVVDGRKAWADEGLEEIF